MTIASALRLIERERREYISQAKELRETLPGNEHAARTSTCFINFARDLRRIALELKRPAKKAAKRGARR